MNLALHYDDTYTRDPIVWDVVIATFRAHGHKVYVVTWRFSGDELYGNECAPVRRDLAGKVDGMYFTGRKAKSSFMFAQGICIDVWIDDNPMAVVKSMEGFE